MSSCPAEDYHLFIGDLSAVSELTYSGADCNLGTSGSATFTPSNDDLYWIVVGVDAMNRAGSHGFDSTGGPRQATAGGLCQVTEQINASTCPI